MEKILVIEDDPDIRSGIKILLETQGYIVDEACDGTSAINILKNNYHLLIIDIMLPGISGIDTCKKIRENSYVPILFLTAKSSEADKIEGFAAGGDDYLVKPFSYIELIARVKALIRRCNTYNDFFAPNFKPSNSSDFLEHGSLKIFLSKNEVIVGGDFILLTDIEYKILKLLATYPTKIFSIENIYQSVWEEEYIYSSSNTVMVHIKNLRNKLSAANYTEGTIKTIWGKGYKFER